MSVTVTKKIVEVVSMEPPASVNIGGPRVDVPAPGIGVFDVPHANVDDDGKGSASGTPSVVPEEGKGSAAGTLLDGAEAEI